MLQKKDALQSYKLRWSETQRSEEQLLVPADLALTPGIMILVSLFTLATATAQWLAFLPPSAYLRWIAGRAPRTQGAA